MPIWGGGVVRRGKLQDLTVPGDVVREVEEGRRMEKEKERGKEGGRGEEGNTGRNEGGGGGKTGAGEGSNAELPSGYPQIAEQLLSWSAEAGGNNNNYNGQGSGSGSGVVADGPGQTNGVPNALLSVPPNASNNSAPNGYFHRPMPPPRQFVPSQPTARPYYHPPTPRGPLVGKEAARMRYLIRYYSEVITPVIVAFDSPTNPYRTSILQTAESCQTLRHSIAALSMSCIRQRTSRGLSVGKTLASRTSSQAHCRLMEQGISEFGQISPNEQMQEENFHRITAIRSVNALLADPARHADDLMASLLVLSLLFTCDAGVGSFPVDFTGSKRLLGLRAGRDRSKPDRSGWILTLFAWFDTMTASVNDREAHYLDRTSEEEASIFENLTGCDRTLFAILSQLPRLNMLSQMKPIDRSIPPNTPASPATPIAPLLHFPPLSQPLGPSGPPISSTTPGINPGTDPRTGFWREWHALRQKLLSWHPTNPNPPESLPNLADIISISESFRYSALLYLERLAHPYTPPTHPHIASLVNAAMHHINAVHSDVSLHWPLFITGSECTDETHRSAIRQRCEDVEKNSGLVNNLKHLEVLERIWMTQDPGSVSTGPGAASLDRGMMGGEAFRWRRVLDAEMPGAEYIVV